MDNVVLAYEQSTTDTMSSLKCILQTKVDHNFHKHNYSILLLFNHTADLRHRARDLCAWRKKGSMLPPPDDNPADDAGVKQSTNAEALKKSSTRTTGLGCIFDQEP